MKKRFAAMFIAIISLMVLLTVSVSAAYGADAEVTIYGTQNYGAANDVLTSVNAERAKAGLPALKMEPALVATAMQRAAEISVYYSHSRPDGSECYTAFGKGFQVGSMGENIAWGQSTSMEVMTGWMNSPGHRANILNSSFTSIGVGCFYQGNGQRCWVQVFSSARSSDTYSQSGTKNVSGIPIGISQANLSISVSGRNDCGAFEGYAGMELPVEICLYNKNTSSLVKMDGGCTMSVADSTIAKVQNNALVGLKAGSSKVRIQFAGAAGLYTEIPLEISEQLVLEGYVDASGRHVLTWNDSNNKAYLFGMKAGSDMWSLLAYPRANSYINYNILDESCWTYVLRIRDDNGAYVDVGNPVVLGGLAAPTMTAANVASTGKIKLTWDAVQGATGYEVYYSGTSNGTYKLLYTAKADQLSVTHTGAAAGNDYFYKVRATSGNEKGDFSEVKGVWCDLARPTVTLKNRASDGKPVISWTAVKGATGYEVYRCGTSGGTYTKLITVGADKLSVTHTGAAVGNDYFYKVKALYGSNSKCNSALTAAKGVWCDLPQPKVTVSNRASDGKPVISWDKVSYASGYEVYYADSSTGTYKMLYSTTNPDKISVTHTGAKAGNDYFYKVVAVHKNSKCTGAMSAAKGVWCDLARPTLTVTLNSKGKPYLKWTESKGADAYKVYRSADGGAWELIYTAKGNDFDVTHTGAKSGVRYDYKVVAVCNASSKANSAYSLVKGITSK